MFIPLTAMLMRAPGKVRQLVRTAERRYDLPAAFVRGLFRDLEQEPTRIPTGSPTTRPTPSARAYLEGDEVTPESQKALIAEGIRGSATPEREDRLYPGDIEQFLSCDGLGMAFGAAGVLLALTEAGSERVPDHEDWLLRRTTDTEVLDSGFYTGLHGIAYTLDRMGRREDALKVIERIGVAEPSTRAEGFGLFRGLAGEGLNLLHFARETGDRDFGEAALRAAEPIASALSDNARQDVDLTRAGLMHGWSGACLLFLQLYEATGDPEMISFAQKALDRDLDKCVVTKNSTFEVSDDWRTLPYLEFGSVGVGIALDQYLAATGKEDERLREARAGIDLAASYEFYYLAGCFNGRAGILSYLAQALRLRPDEGLERIARRLVRNLPLYAGAHEGRVVFAGNHLLRLSADLATGSAGILLAINAWSGGRGLPFLK